MDKKMGADDQPATRGDVKAVVQEIVEKSLRPIVAVLAQHSEQLAEIRSHIRTNLVTRDEFHSRMDAFSGLLLDSRQRWAVHADTLKQHDERLSNLEKRPS